MYVISNEPDIPHHVSNTIGIPYPPAPSLAQAADIPPSSKRLSMNSKDVQTMLPTWPDKNYTPDTRWDNATFTTFSPVNAENSKTQLYPNPLPSKLTEPKPTTPHLNILTKGHDDTDKSKTNDTNNLLAELDEQHPRFQELVNINDHLMENSDPDTPIKLDRHDKAPQQLMQPKE